jgi:molybdopterin-guanine dinucleotide biosynthesis protein B
MTMRMFGIAGWSGSGKTTLIEQLIPLLVERGLRVALVKHAHHAFDIDRPGKDSWRHRQAGATQVLVSSPQRWALMRELAGDPEPALPELLGMLAPCDLALVEGYKRGAFPKLEVWRASVGKPLLHPQDGYIMGIATDTPERFAQGSIPVFALTDLPGIAALVLDQAVDVPTGN